MSSNQYCCMIQSFGFTAVSCDRLQLYIAHVHLKDKTKREKTFDLCCMPLSNLYPLHVVHVYEVSVAVTHLQDTQFNIKALSNPYCCAIYLGTWICGNYVY